MSPTTMFGDVPKAPGGGTWKVDNDRGGVETSWDDCRSRASGDGALHPNNLLRCRLFWKHLSSYIPAGNWKCGQANRLFDNYNANGNRNGAGKLTVDECFERCLSHPKCKYFNIVASLSTTDGFCSGCSAYYPNDTDSYTYVGEGACTNDAYAVKLNCYNDPNCQYVGQQSNGCWHKFKLDSNGGSQKADYPKGFYEVTSRPVAGSDMDDVYRGKQIFWHKEEKRSHCVFVSFLSNH